MEDHQIEKVARRLSEILKQDHTDFWVEPEQHYNDHKWLCTFKNCVEAIKRECVKWGSKLVATGVVFALGYGIYVVANINAH